MKYFILTISIFLGAVLRCYGAGDGSFWTISFPRAVLPNDAEISEISLSIEGAESVLIGNLPTHYGVISSNNMSGKSRVDIIRFEKHEAITPAVLPLGRFLSGIQIRSGPSPKEIEKSIKSGIEPSHDRAKKVQVKAVVYFSTPADLNNKFHRRKQGFISLSKDDAETTFHDVEIISD